jgi:hypothetical protein
MARYEVYCPCKVMELGTAVVDGDTVPYLIWNWIHEGDSRAKCKYCGKVLKVRGCECRNCAH